MIAAEAVRIAQTSGLTAAAKRLEEAHQIEQRMLGADAPSGMSYPSAAPHASSTGRERGPVAPSSMAPSVPPMSASMPPVHPSGPPSYLAPQNQSSRPSVPPPMSVQPMSGPASRAPYSNDAFAPGDSGRPSLDPYAFQARLKPSLFRLNAYTLVALAVAAFMLAFVVLWAFFG